MKKGFTLIELLVVVLIIGILAAIALPQYTKAVEKSRATEAISTMNAIEKGLSIYLLNNALPAADTTKNLTDDDLDITLSGGQWFGTNYLTKYYKYSFNVGGTLGGVVNAEKRVADEFDPSEYNFMIVGIGTGFDGKNTPKRICQSGTNTYICKTLKDQFPYYEVYGDGKN
ncbi:prepilin-type N-terminal cleavage/methylation domain-containing protein [Elusimicrobium posterum]|uniref:type IV pilin protein n=1 Tax=Elusimicrobium posterum TaxID=3116653 RepID=UPI003C71C220